MSKSVFSGESYGIGWLECVWTTQRTLTEYEAQRYIRLLRAVKQNGDDAMKRYIKSVYPSIEI